MVTELAPGANLALPDGEVRFQLDGPFDLSALVVGEGGKVSGDADMVFYNAPATPGVRLQQGRLTVTPARLRRGAARVVVVASPEQAGGGLRGMRTPVLTDGSGRTFARLTVPALRTETLLLLAEVYPRGGGWRVRAIGQGYADGLAGLARDYGVEVDDDGSSGPGPDSRGGPRSRGGPGSSRPDTGGPRGRRQSSMSRLLAGVVTATNAERAQHGLGPLTPDARLLRAAQLHTEDMVHRSFFAHENPDGAQVWDRALAAGYPYRKIAENIAAGQRTPAEVVRGWMDSPGHRANILDAELTQIGIGHAEGGSYGVYWTQVFGIPAP